MKLAALLTRVRDDLDVPHCRVGKRILRIQRSWCEKHGADGYQSVREVALGPHIIFFVPGCPEAKVKDRQAPGLSCLDRVGRGVSWLPQLLEHAHCVNPGMGHAVQQLHLQLLKQLTPLPLCE